MTEHKEIVSIPRIPAVVRVGIFDSIGQAMLYTTWNTGVGDGFKYVQV
jgi:hypothetical protein